MRKEQIERALNEGWSLIYEMPAREAVHLWAGRANSNTPAHDRDDCPRCFAAYGPKGEPECMCQPHGSEDRDE